MKRPPGIWFLLSAGVLWLSFQDVYGIRATALIFGRSTSTTTTPGPVANVTDGLETEVVTESSTETGSNTTKPALTGIPQIDYLNDPNLPKELNGYNLSEYPFYERVPDPEEIDFKCDGLHDGFYASIPYKCQVYHHCLFGTRYDFLCANYTAFDQKTFICQFVSDVDCVGSKKFWHRNDALYQAASTTTSRPLNIYTPPPQPNPILNPSGKGGGGQRAGNKRRRPLQRRPQYDYYDYAEYDDDYYEERPRSRRRRPRPRPRPAYDDEYEDEYEDEAYERRNRRPYNRRGGSDRRRNKNRNKERDRDSAAEEEMDSSKDRKKYSDEEDDYRPSDRRKPERDDSFEEERSNNRRKPNRDSTADENRSNVKRKSHPHDEYDEERSRKPTREDKYEDERGSDKRKPSRDDDFEDEYDVRPYRPRKSSRRPPLDDEYEDDLPRSEDRRTSRPRKKGSSNSDVKPEETKPIIIPTTGTIYDRPRVAPRIKPPVPKHEADKYAYKIISKTTTSSPLDDDYYEDYEDELPLKTSKSRKTETDPIKPKSSETKERKHVPVSRSRTKTTLDEEDDALTLSQKAKPKPEIVRSKDRFRNRFHLKTTEEPLQEHIESQKDDTAQRTKAVSDRRNKGSVTNRNKPQESEYYDDDDDYEITKTSEEPKVSTTETPKKKWKPSSNSRQTTSTTTSSTTTTTTTPKTTRSTTTLRSSVASENHRDRPEQIVRIVKRPFLPSRGGNPYLSRGLQPVGTKAQKSEIMEQQGSIDIQQKSKEIHQDEPSTYKPIDSINYSENLRAKMKYSEDAEQTPISLTKANVGQKINEPIQDSFLRKPYVKPKFSEPISDHDNDFKPIKRPQHILRPNYDGTSYNGPRTTQKPKVPERNPLDINENEYDVTLNDALNPTLPNLPVKANYPTGFSPANDYTFSAYQRPRYVLEPIISSANTDYVYQPKQPIVRQRYEAVPQTYNSREQYVSSSNDYKTYYSPLVSGNAKRGITQAQSHPFYTTNY